MSEGATDDSYVKVTVRLFGAFSEIFGRAVADYRLPAGATLECLLDTVGGDRGTPFYEALYGNEAQLRGSVSILVNGTSPFLADGLRARLCDNDQVVLMPLLDGG